MRTTSVQPMLKGMSTPPLGYEKARPARQPSDSYIPNYGAQLAMLTLEIQSTNEKLQQIMHNMERMNQKMTLINARLEKL